MAGSYSVRKLEDNPLTWILTRNLPIGRVPCLASFITKHGNIGGQIGGTSSHVDFWIMHSLMDLRDNSVWYSEM